MSELSDAELLRLSDEWKSGKPFAFEDIDKMALALPRLIARAQKAETDRDALAAALRAVDGILMDEIAGWQDGGGPSLDELKQRRLAALEPVEAWLSEANTDQ